MHLSDLQKLIEEDGREVPTSFSLPLKALWYDAIGEWDQAHEYAQEESGKDGAWVHAYLHRKEGDISNARYWYRQAGKEEFSGTLQQEWEQIVTALLERS